MPASRISADAAGIDFAAIRTELAVPGAFPPEVIREAAAMAAVPPTASRDATDLPFVTLDPVGSRDLDQAVHLEDLADGGHRVHYAIADVARAVTPGGAVEQESLRRGQTYYCPDGSVPLHPLELSEGAASLLPDQTRAAVLWTITLDDAGEPVDVQLERALVRSVAQLDYRAVQDDVAAGRLHPSIAALPVVGARRRALARARHAITLDLPDVEVVRVDAGRWTLELRAQLPVEQWNAEISLLTGMCAARIMIDHGAGLLRTLPTPGERALRALRVETKALGIPWPEGVPPGDVIAGLDAGKPAEAAFLQDAVALLRGAGYTPFTGAPPPDHGHAGVGAPYAHVTAPLRRLVDRFATEICLAQVAGEPVPIWVTERIPDVVDTMKRTDRLAGELERRCVSAVSGLVLSGREGETFTGVVVQIDEDRDRATVALDDPPVSAKAAADGLVEGTRVSVVLESAADRDFRVRPLP